jgi:hypothetical protein
VEFRALRQEYFPLLSPLEQKTAASRRQRWEAEQHYRFGWKALKDGDIPKARQHAKEAFRRNKTSMQSWRLMYCAMRGR